MVNNPDLARTDLDVDPRLLRAFVALARERHFGRAAQELVVAQPALSRQIQQLERHLGGLLFTRGPHGATLTELGELILPEVQQLLVSGQRLVRLARAHTGPPDRTVTIAAPMPSPVGGLLAQALRQFRVVHAGVPIAVTEMADAEAAGALSEGAIDVLLSWGPAERDDLDGAVVISEPMMAMVPSGSPWCGHSAFALETFAAEPLLFPVFERQHCWDQLRMAAQTDGLVLRPVPTAPSAVSDLVAAGLGISAVPASFQLADDRRLAFVPIPGLVCDMSVVWRRGERSPAVAALVSACRTAAETLSADHEDIWTLPAPV